MCQLETIRPRVTPFVRIGSPESLRNRACASVYFGRFGWLVALKRLPSALTLHTAPHTCFGAQPVVSMWPTPRCPRLGIGAINRSLCRVRFNTFGMHFAASIDDWVVDCLPPRPSVPHLLYSLPRPRGEVFCNPLASSPCFLRHSDDQKPRSRMSVHLLGRGAQRDHGGTSSVPHGTERCQVAHLSPEHLAGSANNLRPPLNVPWRRERGPHSR